MYISRVFGLERESEIYPSRIFMKKNGKEQKNKRFSRLQFTFDWTILTCNLVYRKLYRIAANDTSITFIYIAFDSLSNFHYNITSLDLFQLLEN